MSETTETTNENNSVFFDNDGMKIGDITLTRYAEGLTAINSGAKEVKNNSDVQLLFNVAHDTMKAIANFLKSQARASADSAKTQEAISVSVANGDAYLASVRALAESSPEDSYEYGPASQFFYVMPILDEILHDFIGLSRQQVPSQNDIERMVLEALQGEGGPLSPEAVLKNGI